jgi:hypothetical protein
MATYTSAGTGLWSAGATWVGGVKPPSAAGHKIVIASGHTVTYDEASGEYGDDTSSTTAANNAIVVNGTLKASRAMSTQLICYGTLFVANGGTLDWGATGDEIPAAYTAEVVLNKSASMASGKHVLTSHSAAAATFKMRGATRTRNTRLTNSTSAGATSITVDESTGWAVGDRLVIASDTDDPTRSQVVTISAGSSPTWTVGAITNARAAECRVGNLSSNVIFRAHAAANPAGIGFFATTLTLDIAHTRFLNIGSTAGWTGASQNAPVYYGLGIRAVSTAARQFIASCVIESDNAAAQMGLSVANLSAVAHGADDCALYASHGSGASMYLADSSIVDIRNPVVYRWAYGVQMAFSAGCLIGLVSGGESWTSSGAVLVVAGTITLDQHRAHGTAGSATVIATAGSSAQLLNCQVSGIAPMLCGTANAIASSRFVNCTFDAGALTATMTTGSAPSQLSVASLIAVNGTASDSRVRSYWQETVTDTSTRNRSTYSVKIKANVANTATRYTFAIPVVSGVALVVKPALRWDTNYVGSGLTKPTLTLSGQGISQTFTPSGSSVDTWYDTTITATPTSTGDVTATVTVQSTATTGFVWLDGLYHFPMTQSVRHFGYQWLPQSSLVADSTITLSEAAALALPVAVNHGTSTITISGNCTAREIYEACMADLCATANQAQAQHITPLLAGESFTTSYDITINTGCTVTGDFSTTGDVTLTGTADVDGVYTDASGVNVKIQAANLVSGSRVQLYDVDNTTELLNAVLSGAGLVHRLIWTTDTTIRLRADHADKLPLETTGVLTASGLQFLSEQAADDVYAANAIDGSAVTEFTADLPNVQIDLDDPDGVTSVKRLYAWFSYYQTTSAGIASPIFGAMDAFDELNYIVDQDKADLKLDNVSASPVIIAGGYLSRKDGSTVIDANSGSIQMDPGRAYVASGAGASAADVWAYATRTLTADPGASAHATTQAAIAALPAPLDAAGTRAAVGLAAANLDTQLAALPTDADVQTAAAAALTAYDPPTAAELASVQSALAAEHDATQSAIAALPAAPSASTVAGAVRTELATELARVDVAISTRLSAAGYTAPLDSTAVQAAAAAALAAYDAATGTDVSTAQSALVAEHDATQAAIAALPADVATAVLAAAVETGYSVQRILRIIAAAVAGKTSGGPAGFTARDVTDSRDQITGTADSNGNRTAASYGA